MNTRLLLPLLLVLAASTGCITTYVGDPEKSVIDDKLLGVWYADNGGGNEELWFVHPLDKRSYLVQRYGFKVEDGLVTRENDSTPLHAWLTTIGGQRFLSMRFFAPEYITKSADPESKKKYAVVRLDTTPNGLKARAIDPAFVEAGKLDTPAALEAAIAARMNDDAIYKDKRDLARIDLTQSGPGKQLIEALR